MFGNQNIHFWEGLFSKCFFLPLVAVFGFLDFLFLFYFFLVRCKKRDGEGKGRREGKGTRLGFLLGLNNNDHLRGSMENEPPSSHSGTEWTYK